jgi:competence protein ComEA
VLNPGVYELPPRNRVQDAIAAAGGLIDSADTNVINLAAFIEDGQYLAIPYQNVELIYASPQAPTSLPTTSRSAIIDIDGPININTANQEELETLPGVGPVIAQRIIEYRQINGSFQTIEDIQKVQGIGPKTFEKMQEMITVSGP